jgi:glycosyltransferase involved in cell wall biosynthesis
LDYHIIIDAVGNKEGGGAVVLTELVRAALRIGSISRLTILASPGSKRKFRLPQSERVTVTDVNAAEGAVGRVLWAYGRGAARVGELRCDVFLAANGIGFPKQAKGRGPSSGVPLRVLFVQQPVPYSAEALARYNWAGRIRMAVIRRLTRRAVRQADDIVVQTPVMARVVSEAFDTPLSRIAVFPPGAPFLPASVGASKKLHEMKRAVGPVLLYVGYASPHKNLPLLFSAMKELHARTGAVLYVTLDGTHSARSTPGLSYLGPLEREELREAYDYADVLVMPSVVETVGLPMLEAMEAGVPVACADRPYGHAVCEDAALFFEPNSTRDIVDKIAGVLSDASTRQRLIEAGRRLVHKKMEAKPYESMILRMLEMARKKSGVETDNV